MPAIANLIYALGIFLFGSGYFLHGLTAFSESDIYRRIFQSGRVQSQAVENTSRLSDEAEAMHVEFARVMDLQYQLIVLKRKIGELPSLPNEGY